MSAHARVEKRHAQRVVRQHAAQGNGRRREGARCGREICVHGEGRVGGGRGAACEIEVRGDVGHARPEGARKDEVVLW